jgi:hypothetical protein
LLLILQLSLLIPNLKKHKKSFLSENYGQTFPNKQDKQSNANEKHKVFPSENYNRIFHNKSIQNLTAKGSNKEITELNW